MRVPRRLYVIFVRLKTGSSVVHASTGHYRLARRHFLEAEERLDIDQIWFEMYVRNPPIGSKARRS